VQPESWVQRHNQSLRLAAVILVPLLLFFSYEWYRLIRRRLVLQRKRGKRPPFSWPIHPEASPSEIYDSTEFYGAARRLQRRQVGESYHLDIGASVEATVHSLGFPRLQYKPDRKLPEYLVLVDRASFRDHQANLFHDLVRALRDEGLYANLFFFEGDPRVSWDEERGDTVPLFELQRRYAGHRLLLLSNGEKLIDALSGSLAGWTSLLLDWKDRGVLTPEPLAEWGLREKALASQFIVLPATTEGLFALGDYFELPSQPDTAGLERTSPDQAPPQPDDPGGIEALRNYLGGGTFRWLAACAVYPELHWDLTLYLGSLPCFGPGLVTEQNLLKLVRLPWFRRGSIPDELRLALIQELGQDTERAVREAIVDLLEKNPAPKETYASDARQFEILFQRYWLDRQNSKKRGDLIRALRGMPDDEIAQNYTLLQSAESVSKSRLDLVLPARLRRMLFPSGFSALGLRTPVRLLVTLVLIGVGLLVFAPQRVGILTVDVFPIGARISIDGRSDPSWVAPHTFRNLPAGKHNVVISMDGFWNLQKTVTIDGGQISGVDASLFAQTGRGAPGAGQETPEELLRTCRELVQSLYLGKAESYCNRVIDKGGTLVAEAQELKKQILTLRNCEQYYSNVMFFGSRRSCPQAIEFRQKMQQSCSDFSGLDTLDRLLQSQCPEPQSPPGPDQLKALFDKSDPYSKYIQEALKYEERPNNSGIGIAYLYYLNAQRVNPTPRAGDPSAARFRQVTDLFKRKRVMVLVVRVESLSQVAPGFTEVVTRRVNAVIEALGLPDLVAYSVDAYEKKPDNDPLFQDGRPDGKSRVAALTLDITNYQKEIGGNGAPEEKQSQYKIGQEILPNPEYEKLRQKVEEESTALERNHSKTKPTKEGYTVSGLAILRDEMDKTPKEITRDKLVNYTYQEYHLSADVHIGMKLTLRDMLEKQLLASDDIESFEQDKATEIAGVQDRDVNGIINRQAHIKTQEQLQQDAELDALKSIDRKILALLAKYDQRYYNEGEKALQAGHTDDAVESFLCYWYTLRGQIEESRAQHIRDVVKQYTGLDLGAPPSKSSSP